MTRLRKPVAGKPLTFHGRQWATSGAMVEWVERKPNWRAPADAGGDNGSPSECAALILIKDEITTEAHWSTAWDGESNAEFVFDVDVGQPFAISVSGYVANGYDISDLIQEYGAGSFIEALDTNGAQIGYAEPTSQECEIPLTYHGGSASLKKLMFHTERPTDGRQGFGFSTIRTYCPTCLTYWAPDGMDGWTPGGGGGWVWVDGLNMPPGLVPVGWVQPAAIPRLCLSIYVPAPAVFSFGIAVETDGDHGQTLYYQEDGSWAPSEYFPQPEGLPAGSYTVCFYMTDLAEGESITRISFLFPDGEYEVRVTGLECSGVSASKWCGLSNYGTFWDAEEQAWVSNNGGSYSQVITPATVGGVEWWNNPRPDSLTFEFMTGPLGQDYTTLHILSTNETVAEVDLGPYENEVWHTITVHLDWDLDPDGQLSAIAVTGYIYTSYEIKLRMGGLDAGEMCSQG